MDKPSSYIDSYEAGMVKAMSDMVKIPAVSPESGGAGESDRVDFLEDLISSMGFKAERYDYKDNFSAKRSSLIVKYGTGKRRLWIIPHIDTVSVGEKKLWDADPFSGLVKQGRIYGRGTSDNGQDVIAGIYALKAVKESAIKPKYAFGLALMADEETGSEFGAQKLIKEGIFKKDDLILVPDAGDNKGSVIEIAEKGKLMLKIEVHGKQAHASRPNAGLNASFHAMKFLSMLSEYLYGKYNYKDKIFYPEYSTFELTKREANVDSYNIVPGLDVSYLDCRILPKYNVEDIFKDISKKAEEYKGHVNGLDIKFEPILKSDPAPATDPDSEIVKLVSRGVEKHIGIKPKITGRGGGTIAYFFRMMGMQAAVWSIKEEVAHASNEYCVIEEMKNDAKVFASLFE